MTETPDTQAPVRSALVAWLDRIARWLAIFSGVVLVALTLLTVADVGLRYLFNSPIFGAHDLMQLGLVIVVFGGLAYAGRSGGHVAVDVFTQFMSPAFARWTDFVLRILAASVFVILAWRSWVNGLDAALYGEASNLLFVAHSPFYQAIALGAGLYAVILVIQAWIGVTGGSPEDLDRASHGSG